MAQKNLSCSDARGLLKLVDHDHPELSVSRQCALLGLPRSTLYYRPRPVRKSTLRIMARIDALYLEDPCSGSRRMVDYLAREVIPISRDRVRNLLRRMGLGRSTRSRAPRFQETHRIDSPAWWTSDCSGLWIRSGPRTSPTSRCRRDSSTWWRSLICSRETSSAGSSRTAWTQSSVCRHWRWYWEVGESQRSSIPIRAVNSLPVTSWTGCRQRGSRSAGQARSSATTTSWWRGCGARSNTRRCTCMPTAMAGMQKSAWPDSYGGTAM